MAAVRSMLVAPPPAGRERNGGQCTVVQGGTDVQWVLLAPSPRSGVNRIVS